MSTLQEYISVIGSFQGFLLFVLLVTGSRMTTASRILGAVCLLIALTFLFPFLLLNIENNMVMWSIGWLFYLPAILGPATYLYCRSALTEKPITVSDLVHLIPLLFCYVMTVDLLIGDPQEIAQWIAGTYSEDWRLSASEYVIVAQAFGYGGWTLAMILRYRKQAHANLANFNVSVFRWLLLMQLLILTVVGLKALPGLGSASETYSDIANLLLVLFVYFIAAMQWRNPQFFIISGLTAIENTPTPQRESTRIREQDGELDPAIRTELFKTVKSQFESEQIYLDSTLTLARLAAATRLSKHHLSEVLNRHAGKNFYQFINGYRVDFVCKRLEEGSTQNILDIALEAGFSSKSTFNAIFKQFTGRTPTQYRNKLKLEDV
ncbi:helix-turn-helix domain-containing protein [Robiginitomaculum antarcticum]|uniref:helix-turn-helix domain-containing protein n=1 Tax=Robiginitomaculum antarcticum TaxID=437507 RepID=UPI000373331A|nr:helix-turn-helix domain-containing protein [Robiginitomaculum antarcticum]